MIILREGRIFLRPLLDPEISENYNSKTVFIREKVKLSS